MKLTKSYQHLPPLREILGMTQKALADEVGMSRHQLNHIFQGRSKTSYANAEKLAVLTKTAPGDWMKHNGIALIRIIAEANGKTKEQESF